MRNIRQLFWGHGEFLAPQHLQQLDLFHIERLTRAVRGMQPHQWGVARLEVREEGLAAGEFDATDCELVTRDGLILVAGPERAGNSARLAPRSFQGMMDPAQGPLAVYLAVARHQPDGRNLVVDEQPVAGGAAGGPAAARRYRVARREVADMFADDAPEHEVAYAEYEVAVLFGRDPEIDAAARGFELVKVAELTAMETGRGARLSPTYVPPILSLAASPALMKRVKDVRDLMTSRTDDFRTMIRERGVRATAIGAQENLRLLMLQTLSRFVPLLHHATEQGSVHPEPLYALLRQIVAELSVFSEEFNALGAPTAATGGRGALPPYDHEDIWHCYNRAIDCIYDLVAALTAGPDATIRLVYDGEYYRADLPESFFAGSRNRYYMLIDSDVPGRDLWPALQRTGKLSNGDDMPRLRQSALFGLRVEYLPVAPEELPQRSARYAYFAVDVMSPHWKRIADARNIKLFCDLKPDETIVKIIKVAVE